MVDEEPETTNSPPAEANAASSSTLINPVPMSFPAILRNKAVNSRFAHLRMPSGMDSAPVQSVRKRSRDDKLGKRWIRRKDNGMSAAYNLHWK